MALDGANFIAELSITDPPGSDPLSQGDDQIRTIKRATFQSFPLIAAAVNLTDVQMNLMAIKNEANVFTADQQINDNDMILNAVADIGASYRFQRAGLDRWTFTMGLDANDNDWSLTRFDALGAFVNNPIRVDFVTGIADFAAVPTIQGDPVWIVGEVKMIVQGAALPSNNWFVCNGTAGTVDLRDRILGAQGVFTGTQTPFLAAKTDDNLLTDGTAISVAQMPAHEHDPWVSNDQSGGINDVGLNAATVWGFGGRRNDATRHYDNRRSGGLLINTTGGGAAHTHTIPELNVEADGLDAFQVMPFTYFMQAIQYVP